MDRKGRNSVDNDWKFLEHYQNSEKRSLIQQIAYPIHREARTITDDASQGQNQVTPNTILLYLRLEAQNF